MSILRLRDKETGEWVEIPALVGPPGPAGDGSGDMEASVYDPHGKATDVFAYVDKKISAIPTPDVSGQINTHNTNTSAHSDIRNAAANAASAASAAQTAATNAANAASAAQNTANAAQEEAESKAPMYTYGTEDLQAGVTALETGKLHFVYE